LSAHPENTRVPREEARKLTQRKRVEKLVVYLRAAQGADVETLAHLLRMSLELAEAVELNME